MTNDDHSYLKNHKGTKVSEYLQVSTSDILLKLIFQVLRAHYRNHKRDLNVYILLVDIWILSLKMYFRISEERRVYNRLYYQSVVVGRIYGNCITHLSSQYVSTIDSE